MDTLPNIEIPSNEWISLYALTGIAVGTAVSVENVGVCDIYLAVQAAKPPTDHDSYNVLQRGNGVRLQNNPEDPGAWAFCNTSGAKINVMLDAEMGFYPHTSVISKRNGVIDDNNSTATPLVGDGVFPGAATDALDFGTVEISVFSDVASAENGLSIEFSADGTKWDHTDVYTVPAGVGKNYSVQRVARYFRIVYTNGTALQTAFRLQVILNKIYIKPSSHRIRDDINSDDDAQLGICILKTEGSSPEEYKTVSAQYPIPTDGDSVYAKDVWKDESDIGNFSGSITDPFDNLHTPIVDSTANNPKVLLVHFHRTIFTSSISLGAALGGDFSNVKIELLGSGGVVRQTVDESGDDTKYTSREFEFKPDLMNVVRFSFFTDDPVTLTNIVIRKATSVDAKLAAVSDLTRTVEDIGSFRGALNINQALVHQTGVNEYFRRDTGGSTTIAIAATAGDTDINVADSTGFVIGDFIRIAPAAITIRGHFHVLNVVANVITINRPIDADLEIGDAVVEIDFGMNEVGTLVAPVSFKVVPPPTERWQITRLMTTMLDATAMDDGKFGGMAALTNGFVIRINKGGIVSTLTHWNVNLDLKDDQFDVAYSDKAPAGQYGLSARWTLTKAEFVADLDGANGDFLEALVQDDLTPLDTFKIKVQGRLFGG